MTSARWFKDLLGARGRSVLSASGWSLLSRAAALGSLLVGTPLALDSLGIMLFGAWAVLASVVSMSTFLDFGLGNGAMNRLASAHAIGDHEVVAQLLRACTKALVKLSLGLSPLLAVGWAFVPWQTPLGLPDAFAAEAQIAAAVAIVAILIAIPLSIGSRALLATGRGNHAFQWQILGHATSLSCLIAAWTAGAGLPVFALCTVVSPLVSGAGSLLHARHRLGGGLPFRRECGPGLESAIWRDGAMFFVLQISAALAVSLDLLLVSSIRGAEEAGVFAIAQRLFSLAPLALSPLWLPLWPAYRHALARGEHQWVTRSLRKSLALAFSVSAVSSFLLALFFAEITEAWLGAPITSGALLLVGFAVWSILESVGAGIATFMNAIGAIRFQMQLAVAFAIASLSAKILLLQNLGSETVPLITASAYFFTVVIPILFIFKRMLLAASSWEEGAKHA